MKDMVSGEHHTLALTTDGTLLSFGRPTYGRLGRPDVDVETDIAEHEPKARTHSAALSACGPLIDALRPAGCPHPVACAWVRRGPSR